MPRPYVIGLGRFQPERIPHAFDETLVHDARLVTEAARAVMSSCSPMAMYTQLRVEYNAHVIEAIPGHVAPGLDCG
jgi:hypothetical protein